MKKTIIVNIFLITIFVVMLSAMNVLAAITTTTTSTNLTYTTGQALSIGLVNQNPDPATSGDVVQVKLGLQNYGSSSINNMVVEIVPSYPFAAVPGESLIQNVGSIGGYQSGTDVQVVNFNVGVDKNAVAGTYDLNVKYYTVGNENNSQSATVSVAVSAQTSAQIIYIDKTLLVPGRQTNLTFTIRNVGSAPLRDMTFYWVNSNNIVLPVGSDNTQYIKYLDVGNSTDINYQVMADTKATAGLYTLNLYLSYTDPLSNTVKTTNTIAGVYVGGGTDFDVAFSGTTTGTTSFTIANTGSNPASSVSVVIPTQSNWRISGTNSMIIGNLNTGDYTVASFNLQRASAGSFNSSAIPGAGASAGASGPNAARNFTNARNITARQTTGQTSNDLTLDIVYTDTLGIRETAEKTVQILSSSSNSTGAGAYGASGFSRTGGAKPQSFFAKYMWYIIVVVVLAGGFVYWQYRKKKLLNNDVKLKDVFKNKKK